MPQPGWRSSRVVAAVAATTGLVGVSVLFIVLGTRNQEAADAAILPPIMPTADAPYASAEPQFHIPAAITAEDDARAKIPLSQPEVHWVFADGPNLPPLVSPCGGYLPSDGARVGANQLALVSPTIWKLSRIVVYRDVNTARQAMGERRAAVQGCAHYEPWRSAASDIVAPLSCLVTCAGVVMRQGRTLVMYVDFGQSRTPPTLEEIGSYATVAGPVAADLASAPWNQ